MANTLSKIGKEDNKQDVAKAVPERTSIMVVE